jgi:hypothetical protein
LTKSEAQRAVDMQKLAEAARGHGGYLLPADSWRGAELRRMERAWAHGALGALMDALLLCEREGIPPPPWIAPATAGAFTGFHDDATRGRNAAALTRHRANIVHRLRWEAVVYVQDLRGAWRKEDAELPRLLREAGADDAEIARAMEGARRLRRPELRRGFVPAEMRDDFMAAQRLLDLTPAGGGGEAVRRSYGLVEEERRTVPDVPSFYLPSDDALGLLGMEDLAGIHLGLLATEEAKRRRKRPR